MTKTILPRPTTPEEWAVLGQEFRKIVPMRSFSYSSVRQFISDQQLWSKKYLRGEWDDQVPLAMVVGSAIHLGLEKDNLAMLENGEIMAPERVKEVAINYLLDEVEKGKVQLEDDFDIEKQVAQIEQIFDFYFPEKQKIDEFSTLIKAEANFKMPFVDSLGNTMPLPLSVKIDRIGRLKSSGKLVASDYKTVASFSEENVFLPEYSLQQGTYFDPIKQVFGEDPEVFQIIEIKKSKTQSAEKVDDLKTILAEQGIAFDKKMKKDDLLAIAIEAGAVKKPEQVHLINFKYTEIDKLMFEEMIRRFFYQIYLMCATGNSFLPNPFGYDMSGWEDFFTEVKIQNNLNK